MFNHSTNTLAAFMLRQSIQKRWPLTFCTQEDLLSSHSFEVAIVSHQIALYGVVRYGRTYNPAEIAVAALYHEASESGGLVDLPSPIKYANPDFTADWKRMEDECEHSLVYNAAPEDIRPHLANIIIQKNVDPEVKDIVKAADLIVAFIKAFKESNRGNDEFDDTAYDCERAMNKFCQDKPEALAFMEDDMPLCLKSLNAITAPRR